jgi:hypothetical protein
MLSLEEEQLSLVKMELQVVCLHPLRDVSQVRRNV